MSRSQAAVQWNGGGERNNADTGEEEFERMLDEPRVIAKKKTFPGIKGPPVQYTRNVLYHQEDDDFDASRHALPLHDDTDGNGKDPDGEGFPEMPDVYEDAKYADMEEQPEAIAQYRTFLGSQAWRKTLQETRAPLTTPAAQVRAEARAQEAVRRRALAQAMSRVENAQEDLLSANFARNLPNDMVVPFFREAAPVLAILLPRYFCHKQDVVHESLSALIEALQGAGCTHRATKLHVLRGPLARHLTTEGEREAYEPFEGPPRGTVEALEHTHFDAQAGETRVVEVTFSCIFSGDDDGDESEPDDDDEGAEQARAREDATRMERAVHLELDDAQGPGQGPGQGWFDGTLNGPAEGKGNAPGGDEPEDKFRYFLHVICHEVEKGQAILCFRTFYFSR